MDKNSTSQIVAIRFHPLSKLYHFGVPSDCDVEIGDFVIVSTSRGREMGQVIAFVEPSKETGEGHLKYIEKRATPQDLVMHRMWQQREAETLESSQEKVRQLGLRGVKIARADFSYDGSRLVIFYTSEGDEKVDLRPLQKRMQKSYHHCRIELKQIGPRDMAKLFGGMGACGLENRCCSRFLPEFSPISIRMAKAQGISLNPQEITGICGRLRCCLIYEYEQYTEARKRLPKKNKRVMTPMGEGKIVDVVPLKEAVIVALEEGVRSEFLTEEIQLLDEQKASPVSSKKSKEEEEESGQEE
jgi:cell fate regulator YaaT (PSP1 superfamily)